MTVSPLLLPSLCVQESKYARALDMLRRVENLLLDDVDIDKRVYKELRALLDDAFGYYYFQRSKYVLLVLCPTPREESGECGWRGMDVCMRGLRIPCAHLWPCTCSVCARVRALRCLVVDPCLCLRVL
jgi:hypothetical protein